MVPSVRARKSRTLRRLRERWCSRELRSHQEEAEAHDDRLIEYYEAKERPHAAMKLLHALEGRIAGGWRLGPVLGSVPDPQDVHRVIGKEAIDDHVGSNRHQFAAAI